MRRSGLGQWGEEHVAKLYEQQGFQVIAKNYRAQGGKQVGEIDLIALRGRELVFIEVKTRTNQAFGTGAESVTDAKQRKLVRACKHYLQKHPEFSDYQYRIDVAIVTSDLDRQDASVTILPNAVDDRN